MKNLEYALLQDLRLESLIFISDRIYPFKAIALSIRRFFMFCLLSQFCYANDHLLRNRNILIHIITMSSPTSVIRNFESPKYEKEYINNCYTLYAC